MKENPFLIMQPDEMTAQEAADIFVDIYTDKPVVRGAGNTMITGVRGCGKSMLIRCSLSDFQMLRENKKFSELSSLAVVLPVKKTGLALAELMILEDYFAPYMMNEHYLTIYVMLYTFLGLTEIQFDPDFFEEKAYVDFFNIYIKQLRLCGCDDEIIPQYESERVFFDSLYNHMLMKLSEFKKFIANLYYNSEKKSIKYDLPFFSYEQLIVPIFKALLNLPGFPEGKKILLFIDDADYLNKTQTKVLNSWLVSRTQPTISIKVSAQEELYKTFLTYSEVLIESPHDFQEINISPIYTSNYVEGDYYNQAIQVLYRRLQLFFGKKGYPDYISKDTKKNIQNMKRKLEAFFPYYVEQEERIRAEERKLAEGYAENGRGNRKSDDIRRYAIPNYIRSLGGTRKSTSKFRYAGLNNIIHLSSGNLRYLLDSVASMYHKAEMESPAGSEITVISSTIQNYILREKGQDYLFRELKRSEEIKIEEPTLVADDPIEISDNPISTADKLGNLINAMGKTFYDILVSGDRNDPFSGRAERKVFSIALSNPHSIDAEISKVFRLGVQLGFLQKKTIGSKEGGGRTQQYILNRCFAPVFGLDPTGFQGYLFVTNEDLKKAIHSGKRLKSISQIDDNSKETPYQQMTVEDYRRN